MILLGRAQARYSNQHAGRKNSFQIFLLPEANVGQFKNSGKAQAENGSQSQTDEAD